MIPLKLYMRNFMCYREQTLDLRGIHLACLTGRNGHGKSAILDAITWALWGHSRVGARRDDELVHIGQDEMEVEFEFHLLAGRSSDSSVRYRVIRKRTKSGTRRRGQSSLDFQGWDDVEGKFRSLTEPAISQTQGRIDDLLRMDYDTFINSAFLLQGRADEFTVKRPAERKRVLGDILGLGTYDRYERLSKEAAQQRKVRADQLMATIDQIDRELAREPEYVEAARAAEAELAQLRSERAVTEAAHNQARAALQEAQAAREQLASVQSRIAAAQAEADRLAGERQGYQNRLLDLESALSQAAEIERGFKSYRQALDQNEAMNAKLAELVSLNEQRGTLDGRITAARHELDVERTAAAERARQLEEGAGGLEQEAEWQAVQADLAHLEERASEKERAQEEIQTLTAESAARVAENERAKEDAEQLKEKIDLLSAADERREAACCPLCGQPLEGNACAQLLDTFRSDLETAREAYRQRTAQVRAYQQQITSLRAAIADIDLALRKRTGWQRKEAALSHVIEVARQAAKDLPGARQVLGAIEARLKKSEYALGDHEALARVEQQLGELGHDANAHRQVQVDVSDLRPYEEKMQTLREARSGVEAIRLATSQLCQQQARVEADLQADRAQAESLGQIVDQIPDLQRQSLEARQSLEIAHDREQQASLRLGAARNKVDHCSDLRRQRVQRRKEEQELREEQAIYQELQHAFSKNGVQAMIIEGAIPDIEQEANRLLARMTRGRMQVRFETQRDTQKGDTVETLDIHISDEVGTRSYETYSGGERYRIDFAIRIALSKLLARRAGAQLQMLVIDEGFGTQDSEGRDGLLDAINAVRDDFACILVITHIEELKDAFNVRIEVTKTAQGSEIVIV